MITAVIDAKRLKVLQLGKFYPPYRGGMESHLKTLCEQLLPDMDVDVIVSNTGPHTVREISGGVSVTRLASLARLASTSVNPALTAMIRRTDADLIHLHWPNPMAALAYLLSRHTGPLVISYHSDVVKQQMLSCFFAPVLRTLLLRAKAIVVSSPNYVESSAILREYRDRCHIIPLGVSEPYFAAPNEAAIRDIRSQYGEKLILSVARFVDYKGLDHLIRAMQSAPGRLLLAGEGPLRRELMALAHSLGLSDRVIFLDAPSEERLRNLYHTADVFVLASTDRREAFGLVQVEAMAAGKPVINTSIASGVPFVSLDDLTGLTVPPSDTGSLAAAITRLIEDASLRSTLGRAARHRAETIFRSEQMKARTLKIYESALRPERVASDPKPSFAPPIDQEDTLISERYAEHFG